MLDYRKDSPVFAKRIFDQFEKKFLFPHDLLGKKLLGYADFDCIWVLYEEGGGIYKVPFAKNRAFFKCIVSALGLEAIGNLPQIYIV